jgi:hypothetical protein
MALAARLVSRSRQLYSAQAALANGGATQVRLYAKEADRTPVNGDDLLKGIFFEVKKKFETALGVLKKEKITIDPDDPAAVSRYAQVMKTVRQKADLLSDSERIKYTIDTFTKGIPDARTYLNTLQEIRIKYIYYHFHNFHLMFFSAPKYPCKELNQCDICLHNNFIALFACLNILLFT